MRLAHWALAALLVVSAWMVYRVETTAQEVLRIKEQIMQTMVTRWRDAENVEHSVSTPRQPNESAEAQAARHDEAVKALKALYPPA